MYTGCWAKRLFPNSTLVEAKPEAQVAGQRDTFLKLWLKVSRMLSLQGAGQRESCHNLVEGFSESNVCRSLANVTLPKLCSV